MKSARRYARVLRHALGQWPVLVGILSLSLCLAALAALQPWPLKILVDEALGGAAPAAPLESALSAVGIDATPAHLVIVAAVAALGLFAATAALDAAVTWAWSLVGQRLVYELACELFLRLQRLSLLFHARRPVGDSITRITGDAWCVHAVTDGILTPARHLFVLVSVGAIAWRLDPVLTVLTLTAAPIVAGSALYFGGRLKRFERDRREAQARVAAFLQQVLGAMPLVQAFHAAPRNREVFAGLAEGAVRAQRGAAVVESGYGAVNGIAITLGMALVLYAGGQRVLAGELTLGSLLVFMVYLRTLETASRSLLTLYGKLRAADASIERVLDVLDHPEVIRDRSGAQPLPAAREPGGHLVFEGVSFGYDRDKPVLRDLSLDVRPGETLALVGESGAGKSTLAGLALRFFDPDAGCVLLDGADLRNVQLASLRSEVSVVLQEPFLLPLSVADNVAYGSPRASREEIVAAAVTANAHEFIRELPHGYDTVLGEQGATLSGGQRQRLAIARALLRNARLLILDEPTSALDTHTERRVVEALERLVAGRTTLIIAHRLSTVRRAHRIAVIAGGQVAEIGSHAELLAAGGRYARLHALQATAGTPA